MVMEKNNTGSMGLSSLACDDNKDSENSVQNKHVWGKNFTFSCREESEADKEVIEEDHLQQQQQQQQLEVPAYLDHQKQKQLEIGAYLDMERQQEQSQQQNQEMSASEKLVECHGNDAWNSMPEGFNFHFGVSGDPTMKLIGDFLEHQAVTGNLCLDMDMDMIHKLPTASMVDNAGHRGPTVGEVSDGSSHGNNIMAKPEPDNMKWQTSNDGDVTQFAGFDTVTSRIGKGQDASFSEDDDTVEDNVYDDRKTGHSRTSFGSRFSNSQISFSQSRLKSRLSQQLPFPEKTHTAAAERASGPVRSDLPQKAGSTEDEEDDPFRDIDNPESFKNPSRSLSAILQWILFFLIMGWLICSLTIPALIARPFLSMALWKWALLALLLFCGRLFSGWIIKVLVFVLERNFLFRKRVLYFIYGLRKSVQNVLWFMFAVLDWRLLLDPKVEGRTKSPVLPYVTKFFNCCLIAAIIWVAKIIFVKVLASSFHVNVYFERIRESLFGQLVLEILSGPPTNEMNKAIKDLKPDENIDLNPRTDQNERSGVTALERSGLIGRGRAHDSFSDSRSSRLNRNNEKLMDSELQQGITIDDLHRFNPNNISAWNMKRLIKFVRSRGVYTLSHIIDKTASKGDNVQEMEISSERQAKSVAKEIFRNVAKPGARFIEEDDLLRFMSQNEVDKALPLFEGARETGKISKNALKNFVVQVVRGRRALSLSLNDTRTAVKVLHRVVDFLVGLVILIICLLVMGFTTTHLLLVISSQLVVTAFIFGNTCKNVFEAIIFLFVMHPFDIGDRCVVDGNQLVVEEMNILSTIFTRNEGERVWYPNSVLMTKYIFNYSCTPDTGDTFDFSIEAKTPPEKIALLKDRIGKYIMSKPSIWSRDFNLVVTGVEDNNKMTLQLMINHTINYSDDLERQVIREMAALLMRTAFYHGNTDNNIRTLPLQSQPAGLLALKCSRHIHAISSISEAGLKGAEHRKSVHIQTAERVHDHGAIDSAKLKAVLFDIDGTLCDSDPLHFLSFQEMLQEVGFQGGEPITEEFLVKIIEELFAEEFSGGENNYLGLKLFPDWDQEKRDKFFISKDARFRSIAKKMLKPLQGLDAICNWIERKDLRRAAVTNAPRANAELMLSVLGLTDFFETTIVGSECERCKPFPDPYQKALEHLGLSPDQAFVLEDSPIGVRAAVGAGIPVVGIATRRTSSSLLQAGAAFVINDYTDTTLWSHLGENPPESRLL